jgi:hypothetical protein
VAPGPEAQPLATAAALAAAAARPRLIDIDWREACRIIPTRYPPVNLFDRVASAEDFEALAMLESRSNDRLRNELGELVLVPPSERVYGPGSGAVMAAFTHLNPSGSRFSAGQYGVFYAAQARETAIAETMFHHGRFLQATAQGPMHLPMREWRLHIQARLHDLQRLKAVHDANDWAPAQTLGAALRGAGSEGIVYRSVREAEHRPCAALFKPKAVKASTQAALLLYAWDGSRFSDVFERLP